jgi:O-antigen/teichoic acid export membrane protein
MFLGYLFWLIMSKITTPAIIGTSSTVVSLSAIAASIATIGVPIGSQRFLGKSFSEQKPSDTKVFVKASLLIVSIGTIVCGVSILVAYNWVNGIFKLNFSLIVVTIALLGSTVFMTLLRSIVIASLKIKTLPIIMILSNIVRIVTGVILVLFGAGAFGVSVSFSVYPLLASILLAITILTILKSMPNEKTQLSFRRSFRTVLIASGASWVPMIIHTVGYYLGPLLVFGTISAGQAGLYFIAYSVFLALSALMAVLFNISYPVLSGMRDGRKRFAWRVMKMSLIVSIPLSSTLIFYSEQIMALFGQDYVQASYSLEILMLSMFPFAFITGVNTLANSYGNYKQVLIVGLASNVPSALLYFILVPIFKDISAAAVSFTAGSVIGFIVSIVIARRIKMPLFWKDMILIFALPTGIAFFLSYIHINYIMGIVITLVTTYILLLRLHIMTAADIYDLFTIMPSSIASPLLKVWSLFYKNK